MVLAVNRDGARDHRENVDWRRVWDVEVMSLIPRLFGSTLLRSWRSLAGLRPLRRSAAPTGLPIGLPFTQRYALG